MSHDITVLHQDIMSLQPSFQAACIDPNISFERESGFALQLLDKNEYLAKVALANRQSLVDAVTNVAALGISLNPANKHAYLVPRDGRVCLDISYMGLIHLAVLTGAILWAQAREVRVGEVFKLRGMDEQPMHDFDPYEENPGAIRGFYSVAKLPNGDYLTHPMSIAKVYAIRDRSDYYKRKKAGPWVTDEVEMGKKTCIKQQSKYWQTASDRLNKAIQYLNSDGDEGLDMAEPAGAEETGSTVGRKPEVAMPQSRSANKPMRASPDAQDVDPRPAAAPAQQAAKPAATDGTPCTAGELAWARKKVDGLAPELKAQLEGKGFNVSGKLDGLTKGQFAELRKELV